MRELEKGAVGEVCDAQLFKCGSHASTLCDAQSDERDVAAMHARADNVPGGNVPLVPLILVLAFRTDVRNALLEPVRHPVPFPAQVVAQCGA
jgi:hypothetical protein